jgi:hypothetical protein
VARLNAPLAFGGGTVPKLQQSVVVGQEKPESGKLAEVVSRSPVWVLGTPVAETSAQVTPSSLEVRTLPAGDGPPDALVMQNPELLHATDSRAFVSAGNVAAVQVTAASVL